MSVKAILLDEKDNVATCTMDASVGEIIECIGGRGGTVTCVEDIPVWHKVALTALPKGEKVIKYGEMIGETSCDIPMGGWVSHENIFSVPRDYAGEYIGKKG